MLPFQRFILDYKYGKKILTLLLGLVIVLAFYLRIDALREQQLSFPNGTDGSLEFQRYAEKLLDYTFDGEIFPPGTVTHKPFFSILLAGVFEIFGRTAFVQYSTTLAISMGQLVLLFLIVRRLHGLGWGVWVVFFVALNAEAVHNSVQGSSVPLFIFILLGLVYLLARQQELLKMKPVWLIGLAAAMATLTREEGWFLLLAIIVVLVVLKRRSLKIFCYQFYPILFFPILLEFFHFVFRRANQLQVLGDRYGTYFFAREFIDHQMPSWYHRIMIHKDFFSISYVQWLFDFHQLIELPWIVAKGFGLIVNGLSDLFSLPVFVVLILSLLITLRFHLREKNLNVEWIALGPIVMSLVLLTPVFELIGNDDLGSRNHYLLPSMTLLLVVAPRGVRRVKKFVIEFVPFAGILLAGFFLVVYYAYHQNFIYGRYEPSVSVPSEVSSVKSFDALENGSHVKAKDGFDRILDKNPRYAPAHFGRAVALWNMSEFLEADSAFAMAINIFPWYGEAYLARALLRAYVGDFQNGLEVLKRCLKIRPDFFRAHLLSARLNLLLGHSKIARGHYYEYMEGVKNFRKKGTQSIEGLKKRQNQPGYEAQGDYVYSSLGGSRGLLSEMMLSDSAFGWGYNHLNSRGYYEVGGQGVHYYRLDDSDVFYNLGNMYLAEGDFRRAISFYEALVNVATASDTFKFNEKDNSGIISLALNNLAIAYLRVEDLGMAKKLFLHAIRLTPKSSIIRNNLGCIHLLLGDFAHAQKYLDMAAESKRNFADNSVSDEKLASNKKLLSDVQRHTVGTNSKVELVNGAFVSNINYLTNENAKAGLLRNNRVVW